MFVYPGWERCCFVANPLASGTQLLIVMMDAYLTRLQITRRLEYISEQPNRRRTKWRFDMNEAVIVAARYEENVLSALRHLKNENIEDALAEFAGEVCFTDRALGLEFTDRERLREFLLKERELYSGSSFHVKKSVVSEDHVIAEWLLQYTVKEPFEGSFSRDVPVSVQGVSVVRTREGKVTEWSDYYDGLIPVVQHTNEI